MTSRTATHAPDKLALKRATDALTDAAGGGLKAQRYCRPDNRRLSDYAGPNTDSFIPIDAVADLEDVTRGQAGWPIVTRALAARQGFTLVSLPDLECEIAAHGVPAVLNAMSRQIGAYGVRQASLLTALADNVLTEEEIGEARQLLRAEVEALVGLDALLQHMEGR